MAPRRRRAAPHVRCPALIVVGTLDPDWADPRAEGEAIVDACRRDRRQVIEGAGHYPHAQFPDETVAVLRLPRGGRSA